MRYIGNKQNIVDKIYKIMQEECVVGRSIFDMFSGSTSVAKYFKNQDYQVFSADNLYFSYCLQQAFITNNSFPAFKTMIKYLKLDRSNISTYDLVLDYLNSIPDYKGFIYKNYTPDGTAHLSIPRMYFSSENGQKIDAIRIKIEQLRENSLISTMEYFILLATLIENISLFANTTGVYAAFSKKWDSRAIKSFVLKKLDLSINKQVNQAYYGNSINLLDTINADIFYLDPPYNERQYAPNYHILETIARYDNPKIKGITGMRNYESQKSNFCNKTTALAELDFIASNGSFKYLVLSYNSEGIMEQSNIVKILSKYGIVNIRDFEYPRYKSNLRNISSGTSFIKENIYILKKH